MRITEEQAKIGAIAALVLVVIFAGKKILQTVGIVETQAEKDYEKNLQNSWLKPEQFKGWVKKTGYKIPSQIENFVLPSLVAKIYDSKGFFNDDEDQVYNFFRALQSKMQCSAVAFYFEKTYERPLTEYLDSFLNASEVEKIVKIINQKPTNIDGFYKQV